VKNSKNSGMSWVCRCFRERERAGEEEISERPGGASSHQVGAPPEKALSVSEAVSIRLVPRHCLGVLGVA
jgi:hypothetical protein